MGLLDDPVKAPVLPQGQGHGGFLPILLGLLALVIWFGYQASELIEERGNLGALNVNQQVIYGNAEKLRTQLDALAAGTAALAQKGNPNAQQIVDAMRAQGITINPNAETAR